jgi:prolyl oligopeptidase PreP (S9A serine peptidase family)
MYLEKIPEWLAEKMNVDLSLVKSSEEVGQLFIARDNQIQNQQMQEVRAQMVLPKNQAMLEQVESERAPNDINIR